MNHGRTCVRSGIVIYIRMCWNVTFLTLGMFFKIYELIFWANFSFEWQVFSSQFYRESVNCFLICVHTYVIQGLQSISIILPKETSFHSFSFYLKRFYFEKNSLFFYPLIFCKMLVGSAFQVTVFDYLCF